MKELNEQWTADIVGRLHRINTTQTKLAKECGYTAQYLSMVLHGKKKFESAYAKRYTRIKITRALERLEYEAFGRRQA